MNWYIGIIIAEIFWSLGNYIDKFLLSKYLKGVGVGALLIFSSLIAIFILPILYLINPDVDIISNSDKVILIITGLIYSTIWVLPYLYALSLDDASLVVPLFQTVPVFSFTLGYLFLGESLTSTQFTAMFIIIVGAVGMSIDLYNFKFKSKIFWLMMLSSFSVALASFLFKFVSSDNNFIVSIFWEYIGISIAAILLLLFIKSYRNQFLNLLKQNRVSVLTINSFNELLNIAAKMLVYFATLSAPLALV